MKKNNRRRALVQLIAALAFLSATDSDAALDRAPVELYAPHPFTPTEVAGLDLTPEVQVEVTINARGAVSEVEILSIEPSTAFDAFYLEVVRDTLSYWRYAPRLEQGEPIETKLRWRVQFRPPQSGTARNETSSSDPRSRVLMLPYDRRLELLDKQTVAARGYLNPATARSARSARFVVYSDSAAEATAEIIARNLEAAYNVLTSIFSPVIEPRPDDLEVRAFVYASRSSYYALSGQIGSDLLSGGSYSSAGVVGFHLEVPTGEAATSTLLHEATHAFLHRHLARRDIAFPIWLNEGLAEYIGHSEIRKGQLIPGRTTKRKFAMRQGGVRRLHLDAYYDSEEAKKALRQGRGPTITDILALDRTAFYGEDRKLYYPMSWLLVHFLRHGREEWTDDDFSRFFLYVAEGYPAADALAAVYGAGAAELDPEFRRYLRDF